jgi:hypothetical protein
MTLDTDAIVAGRRVVNEHLSAGESIEFATAASLRSKGARAFLENFFGSVLGKESVVALTTTRLLVLRGGAQPGRSTGPDDESWLDLQLDRRSVVAQQPETHGGVTQLALRTGLGPRTLVFRNARKLDAADLSRRLHGDT